MSIKNITKESGFTLIEMLVSIALFSVVLTVTLGSIMTIADSNKKSRSLMSVTNNLNFAVDSMVRSFKAGNISGSGFTSVSNVCQNRVGFTTKEKVYGIGSTNFDERSVTYCFEQDAETQRGYITKKIANNTSVELTSSDVDIDFLEFKNKTEGNGQPLLYIIMGGTVKVSEKVSSSFLIQTAVSQRVLEIGT